MLDQLKEIQDIVNDKKAEKSRIEGRIETLLERLKEEGYTSIEKAKSDVVVMKKKRSKLRNIIKKEINTFKNKFADLLKDY
jgi:vacuolar-type H+-ATPase subunit E/Vma4